MMRKIFSLLSKIKIRVISKQPQDLNIYEWQSQIGLCIIISEPKKTLQMVKFSHRCWAKGVESFLGKKII